MKESIKKFTEYSNLSDTDIPAMEDDKLKGSFEIESIIDVFLDPKDIPIGIREANVVGGVNVDLSVKEFKRGEYIWITALMRRPGTTSFNSPAIQGIVKCR